jgi:hypothetical protein
VDFPIGHSAKIEGQLVYNNLEGLSKIEFKDGTIMEGYFS